MDLVDLESCLSIRGCILSDAFECLRLMGNPNMRGETPLFLYSLKTSLWEGLFPIQMKSFWVRCYSWWVQHHPPRTVESLWQDHETLVLLINYVYQINQPYMCDQFGFYQTLVSLSFLLFRANVTDQKLKSYHKYFLRKATSTYVKLRW